MQSSRRIASKIFSFLLLILPTIHVSAQGSTSEGNVYVIGMLIIIGALILVSAVMMLSEHFIQIEAKRTGIDSDQNNLSLIPTLSSLWQPKGKPYTKGSKVIHINKGHDILLNGEAQEQINQGSAKRFSIRPIDFRGLSPIPKVVVEEGAVVTAGAVLFFDKKNPIIKHVAPVSGEVVEIRRGDKRSIIDVVVLADKVQIYKQHDPPSIKEGSRQEIIDFLCATGGWTLFNERPFDVLPKPEQLPRDIFISTFDSAPLAPDFSLIVKGKEEAFQKGIDTLARLTDGHVHLGLDARGEAPPSEAFTMAQNCQKHWFAGKHPSGNVGVQIHHVAPINAGDKVWTLDVQDVITLGDLMYKGIFNAERIVAITGARAEKPGYYKTYRGASISELAGGIKKGTRIIDGDVLSGIETKEGSFLSKSSNQMTMIEEGDYFEMFGWLLPLKPRPSVSKTFPNFLYPNLRFDGDTNSHGEKRAFVVTGQYEKVLPMKIFPQHLMKAIMAGDFEQMEGLGIYELSEEDVALCEFVCTSKMPLQSILRDGLDMMREQG